MKGCKRETVLVSDSGLCVDNIKAAAESALDSHLVLIFFAVLLLIGICNFISSGPSRGANMDNKMQQISNSIDRRKE